jgi:FtsP/CotA-like multicopper oxidase with cupredoxin domain
MSSAVYLWKRSGRKPNSIPGSAKKCSASARNPCSPCARNAVRNQPGILFGFTPECCSACPGIRTIGTAITTKSPARSSKRGPGDTIRIRFTNSLPEETNLHFHGLHVSPTGNADNSFVMVAPGEQSQYELPLAANHPGGTFWIHPHMHGAAARQVWRGLAAPVIVRAELDAIPEVKTAAEVVLVLQDVTLGTDGVPVEPDFMQQMAGREGSVITASGNVNPTIPIQKDGWVRLRLINASCSRFYRLQLEEHALYQIASDGGSLPAPVGIDELLLLPGQRADLMIQGSRAPGAYRLLNLPYNRGTSGMGMGMMGGMGSTASSRATSTIATFAYSGQASRVVPLPQKWSPSNAFRRRRG